ncbi:glycoside hydrolase family 55 protein [Gautieria morchelliformis]|nr:glycoside hydrolase family 55 protein [Gautieria morchelliformis]
MFAVNGLLSVIFTVFASVPLLANALGSSCTAPLGPGNAAASAPYWLQDMPTRGTSAFNANPSTYPVRRNVKDYGAKGDGTTDDTAAINAAIADGSRCGEGTCQSSTLTPALVFFPTGTYLVSSPVISWYYTQLIGDAKNPPTLLAAANFTGIAMIDADVYIPGGNGAQWYQNQNNFFREVRNFVIDLTRMPATTSATGLHWQVSQGTSLYNLRVEMSTASNTAHQGIFMENGSGGFMGDLVFNGGKFGMFVGNQQFTVRNVTINNAQTAVSQAWNWGWTFQGITINNCQIGFEVTTGGITQSTQTAGAQTIIDATVSNTPTFIQTTQTSNGTLAGSLLLDNIKLNNVQTVVSTAQGITVFKGPGSGTISQWAQGNVYSGTSGSGQFVQSSLTGPAKPSSLLVNGNIASRTRPQYEAFSTSQIISVKTQGAKGDGTTDDTSAIQAVINQFWGCKIIFFDAGTYVVTNTITIPTGTIITGEVWPVILGTGTAFQSQESPKPVVQVGAPGSTGTMEITDIIFSTRGPTPGAIVVEWNVKGSSAAAAGSWDTHIRLGSAQGTNLGSAQCVKLVDHGTNCFAAFMALHLTPSSSAYIEAMWVWNGDHDLDGDHQQVSVFSGRGIFSESAGPMWLIGTAEHHVLYQYSLVNAANHYLGLIQTESPYFQPSPGPPAPFSINSAYHDPSFPSGLDHAWALNVQSSTNILVYGAGLYSFFQNYDQTCLNNGTDNCQQQIAGVDSSSSLSIYSLSTVGTTFQFSVNGTGVINQAKNIDGFASTATSWTRLSNVV